MVWFLATYDDELPTVIHYSSSCRGSKGSPRRCRLLPTGRPDVGRPLRARLGLRPESSGSLPLSWLLTDPVQSQVRWAADPLCTWLLSCVGLLCRRVPFDENCHYRWRLFHVRHRTPHHGRLPQAVSASHTICQTAPPCQRASSQAAAVWRCNFPLLLKHSPRRQQPHQISTSGSTGRLNNSLVCWLSSGAGVLLCFLLLVGERTERTPSAHEREC